MVKISLKLVPVNINDDLELILAWRSNPNIYKWFQNQSKPLEWENHYNFWKNRVNRIDWIIFYRERKIGVAYITDLSSQTPNVGLYIGELTLQNQGVGKKTMKEMICWAHSKNIKTLTATIHCDNKSSLHLFQKFGFNFEKFHDEEENWGLYLKSLID